MKYFRDVLTGEIFAYEADGSQDHLIREGLVCLTPEEVRAHLFPPETVEMVLQGLRDECNRRLATLKQDYPDSEVLSWDKQEAEARAGGGPLVAALALARGIDEAELIRRILQKAEAFAILSGTIIGQRQALEDRVRAGEVEVVWPAD